MIDRLAAQPAEQTLTPAPQPVRPGRRSPRFQLPQGGRTGPGPATEADSRRDRGRAGPSAQSAEAGADPAALPLSPPGPIAPTTAGVLPSLAPPGADTGTGPAATDTPTAADALMAGGSGGAARPGPLGDRSQHQAGQGPAAEGRDGVGPSVENRDSRASAARGAREEGADSAEARSAAKTPPAMQPPSGPAQRPAPRPGSEPAAQAAASLRDQGGAGLQQMAPATPQRRSGTGPTPQAQDSSGLQTTGSEGASDAPRATETRDSAAAAPDARAPADVIIARGRDTLDVTIAAATPDLRDRLAAASNELHHDLALIGTEVDSIHVALRAEIGTDAAGGSERGLGLHSGDLAAAAAGAEAGGFAGHGGAAGRDGGDFPRDGGTSGRDENDKPGSGEFEPELAAEGGAADGEGAADPQDRDLWSDGGSDRRGGGQRFHFTFANDPARHRLTTQPAPHGAPTTTQTSHRIDRYA